jgi:hypothetical protein
MKTKSTILVFLALVVALAVSSPAHAFLGLFEDDDAKEEKYKGETDRMRIELQRRQFDRLMDQNEKLMAENRTLYQRSVRQLSALGPGLVYAVMAAAVVLILLLVFLLFKLAMGSRRPPRRPPYHPQPYRSEGPTVGRLVDDEQREIENQFKMLEG